MVLDDEEMAEWIRRYANAGKARSSLCVEMPDAWNVRMTEMQAVLGLSCLRFWDDMRARRARIAQIYRDAGIPCVQDEVEGLRPTSYSVTCSRLRRGAAMREIRARGGRTTARTHGPDENGEFLSDSQARIGWRIATSASPLRGSTQTKRNDWRSP